LIAPAEPADPPAQSEPLGGTADPRPGSESASQAALQIARRGRPRTNPGMAKPRARSSVNGRLPSR
jgi:hypothetical protein